MNLVLVRGDGVKRKEKPEDRREKRDDSQDSAEDAYQPAALSERPKKYDFDDWASI